MAYYRGLLQVGLGSRSKWLVLHPARPLAWDFIAQFIVCSSSSIAKTTGLNHVQLPQTVVPRSRGEEASRGDLTLTPPWHHPTLTRDIPPMSSLRRDIPPET